MAESALYKQLEIYNRTVSNKYRENWGSLLTYLDHKDTSQLKMMSESVNNTMADQSASAIMNNDTTQPSRQES